MAKPAINSSSVSVFPPGLLEFIVFVCGMATMILELTGSRIFAPYLGTSIFVWTSLIGIILGSLSLGYWWGGQISDKNPEVKVFSGIIFFAGAAVGLTGVLSEFVLMAVQAASLDIRLGAVLASVILFGIPGILFGMISPYAVRLKLTAVGSGGKTVGNLYAISTIGSIAGTFLAGFVLVAHFANSVILFALSSSLIAVSLIAFAGGRKRKIVFLLILAVFSQASAQAGIYLHGPGFIDLNTPYNRVWIFDSQEAGTGFPMKIMQINDMRSSGMYLDDHDLAFRYTRFYRLVKHFKPDVKRAFLIGGAACSYPRDFLKQFPDAQMDVVEIDPKLTELARKYFKLEENPRLHIYHEDGRVFLNQAKGPYDVYFGDAFNSIFSIPFHLTTQEAAKKLYDLLAEDGAAFFNIISAVEGPKGMFLRAELATLKKYFPQVYVFAVRNSFDGQVVQNLLVVALKSPKKPVMRSLNPELSGYLNMRWRREIPQDMPVLTDDFAPIDRYVAPIIPRQPTTSHRVWQQIQEAWRKKEKV